MVNSEKFNLGEIIASGPQADSVKPGDRIRFGTDQGYLNYPEWIAEDGQKYIVLSEKDVCFVEEANA